MDASRFDRMAKAAATGVSRRQVLRGLLATAGGGTLTHLSRDESAAGNRCCRRAKRATKKSCIANYGDACKHLLNWRCTKTGPGTCSGESDYCVTKNGTICPT